MSSRPECDKCGKRMCLSSCDGTCVGETIMKKIDKVSLNGVVISSTPSTYDSWGELITSDPLLKKFFIDISRESNESETLIVDNYKTTTTYKITNMNVVRDVAYFTILSKSIEVSK